MRVGVFGAGQLGKMLAEAGTPLGHDFVFLDPNPDACGGTLGKHIVAAFDDSEALMQLAQEADVVTYEFENLPLESVELVAKHVDVFPSTEALRITQDRLFEKEFCKKIGVPCADYVSVPNPDALELAADTVGYPCILKTRRLGYDGKGQVFLQSADDLPAAKELASQQECIVEKCINFVKECSVICTRAKDGSTVTYPLTENTHEEGILRVSKAPAEIGEDTKAQAEAIAHKALKEFAYVGTLAVELFVLPDGSIAVNEFAPRVHNSGHWTIEGAATSQFENHIRAITGMELGKTDTKGVSTMLNFIGTVPDLNSVENEEGVFVHLYGKSERAGRKLGHITVNADDAAAVEKKVQQVVLTW